MVNASALRLRKRVTIAEIEADLATLENAAVPHDSLALWIPQQLEVGGVGTLGAALQYITTWARRSADPVLRTYIESPDDTPGIERLVEQTHGLVGVLMAARTIDRAGQPVDGGVRRAALGRLDEIDAASVPPSNDRFLVVAADHTSHSAPVAIYTRDPDWPTIRSSATFQAIAQKILTLGQLQTGNSARPGEQEADDVADVLYELVQNTHDWARSDVDGGEIVPSVRLLGARWLANSLDALLDRAHGDAALTGYLQHSAHAGPLRPNQKITDLRRFLEITVLDSGPGVASRRLRQLGVTAPDAGEEYSALVDCLRVNMGTSGELHRGGGLDLVQRAATSMRGYLRVRTGRMALVRDFVLDPYRPDEDPDEPWMRDWATNSRGPQLHPEVSGALFTMLIPVGYRDRDDLS